MGWMILYVPIDRASEASPIALEGMCPLVRARAPLWEPKIVSVVKLTGQRHQGLDLAGAGLEHGICSVSKGERAFISMPASALAGEWGLAWPRAPPDVDRIELEVHLRSMLQVRHCTALWEHQTIHIIPSFQSTVNRFVNPS